ncbi:hypothetical protein Bcep1808_0179 [Burkholderia vietnamiensis G4]|uniref:Uncharacterized protein n=1 Tax=Burkholderia vietnamiensis (strain G4 / LMG 22486) TaxID=269482 RepID=A4JA99_BURVG|nr:hypothetical protein Bcep1808_0179 [Burkholderia vietnamiensis G4]
MPRFFYFLGLLEVRGGACQRHLSAGRRGRVQSMPFIRKQFICLRIPWTEADARRKQNFLLCCRCMVAAQVALLRCDGSGLKA